MILVVHPDKSMNYVPICTAESFMSDLTASGTKGENANHDRKADQNPSHDLSVTVVCEPPLSHDSGTTLTSGSFANIDFLATE